MRIIIKIGAALAGLLGGAILFDALAERTADKVVEKLVLQETEENGLHDDDMWEPDKIT